MLAAAFLAVVPGTAFAGHDLGIYKVEKQVDMNSDDQSVDLSCAKNDFALDGMWRIDHADQDDDDIYLTSIGRAVDVQAAYPEDLASYDSDSSYESYHFDFNKNAIGRAQLKVWVVCIKSQTEQSGGHSHSIPFAPASGYPKKFASVAGGGYSLWPGGVGTEGTFSQANACPPNYFVAAPGYMITPSGSDPAPYVGHLSEDWPITVGASTSPTGWSWIMDLSQDSPAKVDYYLSCVGRKLPSAGSPPEKHKLVYRLQGPEPSNVAKKSVQTKRISCQAHYKAVVAGMSFSGPSSFNSDLNPDFWSFKLPYHWWLGMDPQPKSRDFRFLNSDGAAVMPVNLKAICLNYRTT